MIFVFKRAVRLRNDLIVMMDSPLDWTLLPPEILENVFGKSQMNSIVVFYSHILLQKCM